MMSTATRVRPFVVPEGLIRKSTRPTCSWWTEGGDFYRRAAAEFSRIRHSTYGRGYDLRVIAYEGVMRRNRRDITTKE